MPYYSELGLTPSTSAYSALLLNGPYSNHSSIIASNYQPFSKTLPRQIRGGFKPHLSTISEFNSPLRRINSPKYHSYRPIIKTINTADIDVSHNRLRRFEKYERPKTDSVERVEKTSAPKKTENLDKTESPKKVESPKKIESPRISLEEREARPNPVIRRDRATIRLQTVHQDTLEKEIGEIKSWRDNFKPDELGETEVKRRKKSPGELLKEKFLIRSRSKENVLKGQSIKKKRNSVRKSPSFHDICQAITSDNIEDELNPGQPEAIQRKQSRQLSTDKIIREIRRRSTDLSEEDIKILDAIITNQDNMNKEPKEDNFESRNSVRKKKVTKKKSVIENGVDQPVTQLKENADYEAKKPIQRQRVQNRVKRTISNSSNSSENTELDTTKTDNNKNKVRDISQVDIEQTKYKPKPIITASNVDIEPPKPSLKAVVDDVEVEESPKKLEKKFRFNVIVEVEEKPKKPPITAPKMTLGDNDKVTTLWSKPKQPIITSILKKSSPVDKVQIMEPKKKKIVKKPKPLVLYAVSTFDKITPDTPSTPSEVIVDPTSPPNKFNELSKKDNKSTPELGNKFQTPLSKTQSASNPFQRTESPSPLIKTKFQKDKSNTPPPTPIVKKLEINTPNKTNAKAWFEESAPTTPASPFKRTGNFFIKENESTLTSNDKKEELIKKDSDSILSSGTEDQNKISSNEKSIGTATVKNYFPTSPLKKTGNFFKTENETPKSISDTKEEIIDKGIDSTIPNKTGIQDKVSDAATEKQIGTTTLPQSPLKKTGNFFKKESDTAKGSNKKVDEINEKESSSITPSKIDELANGSYKPINGLNESSSVQKNTPTDITDKSVCKTNVVGVNKDKQTPPAAAAAWFEEDNSAPPSPIHINKKFFNKDVKTEIEEQVIPCNKEVIKSSVNKETENNQAVEAKNRVNTEDTEKKKRLISKRSLVQKATKDDPDLEVFIPPEVEPEPEPEPEPKVEEKTTFVPLQSNRLSQWMHPWKKPEQFDVCPVEIFARPKLIRGRHYPRPKGHPAPQPEEESSSEEESDESDDTDSSEEETSSEDECDSGFGSKDKGSSESRDSPTSNHANNPAFALDSGDLPEEYSQSSTFASFQKSGRITPPATTIPRFRKYCVDDFNFLKVLGKGSFGKVLLAELKGTEYYYAVKCLKKDVVLEDDDVECTLIERKVLALGTKHPYLCHLLCTFQTESHLFFVMEYLNGGDLMFHIQASGRFPEHQARFYGAEIISGLKFLHNKGIVYRDLKLDNVLLDFDGHVRIADFGMCKLQIFLDRMAETFCGTPDYMAPEIIKGLHYNQCVDWWSFGVLLYEMLLGQSPFSGCDEDELFWSICNEKPVLPRFLSAEATNVLTMLLEKDASKRLGNRFCPHGDIQDHAFFRPIDWPALEARQLESPFKPNLQHPLDTQYFDKHFTVEKAKITPTDPTILHSMDQTQFQGFSYTNPNATDK